MPDTAAPPRSGPTKPKFDRLDANSVREASYAATLAELQAIEDRRARFEASSKLAIDLAEQVVGPRRRRNELLVGLYVYYKVKASYTAAGMARSLAQKVILKALGVEKMPTLDEKANVADWEELAELAAKARIRRPRSRDKALVELGDAGRTVLQLTAARSAAVSVRDADAVDLWADEAMTWSQLIETMGVDSANLSHILTRARAAGRDAPTGPRR